MRDEAERERAALHRLRNTCPICGDYDPAVNLDRHDLPDGSQVTAHDESATAAGDDIKAEWRTDLVGDQPAGTLVARWRKTPRGEVMALERDDADRTVRSADGATPSLPINQSRLA